MVKLPYDLNNKDSIIHYAKQLVGKSLKDICEKELIDNHKNKGGFGQLLEKFYFLYEPNSDSEPDFKEVGLELKSSPIKKLKRLDFVSKERLVLNIINYLEIVKQDFETSSFWKKNKNLLLIFYFYENDKKAIDFTIDIVDEWKFSEIDLEIIKKDWNTIHQKVKEGKAHELSEGDTLYLGACTKGSKGGNLREQPNNIIKAKQRAFSLKQGYVNHIIATLSGTTQTNYGKIIQSLSIAKKTSLEDIVLSKFEKYNNKTIDEIQTSLNIKLNNKAKNFYANLVKAILGIELHNEIEEFTKADISVKTIRLDSKNNPKEQISFPAFKFNDLVKEKWEESAIYALLEKKFLFVFFKFDKTNILKLSKIKFWNMPFKDREEVKKVWIQTKKIILNGDIVESIYTNKNGKLIRKTNFPNKQSNKVTHIRPHAQNSADTYPLPVTDKFTQSNSYTKQCFWLNSDYVKNEIFSK
jgi:DNA mismatch repair protein MutH